MRPRTAFQKDERDFATFLAKSHDTKPKPFSSGVVALKAVRAVQQSPLAQIGAQSGVHEDARSWMREAQNPENADAAFWTNRAPRKSARMWDDPSVPDEAFAADQPIVDYRQVAARKH